VLAQIDAAWRREIDEYASASRSIASHLQNPGSLTITSEQKAMLLGAALPATPFIRNLRQQARQAATADARACRWYSNLGAPATAPPAWLLLLALPAVAGAAASEIAAQRQAQREARLRFIGQCFKYGTIPVLIIVWIIHYNSPAQVTARQEEARKAEIARQEAARQAELARQEQIRKQQEAQRALELARQAEMERRARCTTVNGSEFCCPTGMRPVSQMAANYAQRLFCCPPNARTAFIINPRDLLVQGCTFERDISRGLFGR
jgi:hypothetical protein